ncbi:MAG: hypothetical protein WC600_18580 [Desulfobaccales bacterium]
MPETISITFDALIHMTDQAALFDFDGDRKWIPLSLIDPDSLADLDLYRPDTETGYRENEGSGEIIVPLWFVKQEGLESYET